MKRILFLLFVLSANIAFADGTATASASSREDACSQAQSIASEGGQISSDCSCVQRGAVNICHVQYRREESGESVIDKAKHEMKDRYGCDPDQEDCGPNRTNGGPGRRS